MVSRCRCAFVPTSVLDRFAVDLTLSETLRQAFQDTAQHASGWRSQRTSISPAARHAKAKPQGANPSLRPEILIFDSRHSSTLPGNHIAIADPYQDETAHRIHQNIQSILLFYKSIFNRNSVDNNGMGIFTSIHYGNSYCNAYWNGSQMVIGDGDGEIFTDFAFSDDVLVHELTHGVTQYTLGLGFTGEPGALNESLSDIFSAVYRQWRLRQSSQLADWTIGSTVLGQSARKMGYTCLRSLSEPDSPTSLMRLPGHMRDWDPNGDPHINSGIPSQAFYRAAMQVGGNTWDRVALIWYSAMANGRRQPNMTFAEFASATITRASALFRSNAAVPKSIENSWRQVGVI